MPEGQQTPRHISTRAASTNSSASLDVEAIRRAIERSQEFGPAPDEVAKTAPTPVPPAKRAAPAARKAINSAKAAPAARRPASSPAAESKQDTAPLFATERMFYDQDRDPDFPPKARQDRPKKGKDGAKRRPAAGRTDLVLTLLTLVFSVALLVSGGILVKRYLDDRRVQEDFSALRALLPAPAAGTSGEDAPAPAADRFAALQSENPECIGWISIDYTDLSYPVMYSPARPDFYLKHDFAGERSDYGVPYLDAACTLTAEGRSDNLIIYGHNMKTGLIFEPLTGYLQNDFYTVHPTVRLDTLYDGAEYEVFAAFEIDVVQDPDFVYNEYHDMDAETFDRFVNEVKRRSPVDSGITPVYGEDLITLSTCEYDTADGRMVVCARRVSA